MTKTNKMLYLAVGLATLLCTGACKTPQATTLPKDTLKASLASMSRDSSVTVSPAWRDFFQDSVLRSLIDTALQNNHDLKITLQELAIAKSAITAKQGALLPSISANVGAGISKVGRYTAEGAGNVGTELTPGRKIPTVIPDLAPTLQMDWTVDLWGKLNSDKKSAVERYLASEAGQRAIKSQLVADVAENYYVLLALDYKLLVMQQYIALQKNAVRIARIQKEADADTQLAVEKFEAELAKAQADSLSPDQVITVASIVEQETAYNPEKPMVAAMYLNRLHKHMPLQADPTVKFALGNFGLRRIMNEHLKVDSPYNTYKQAGLPPGPICIPSMSSINAVLDHAHHNYFYMCAKEDFSGSHNFAETYGEHLKNAAKYAQALNARGIK